MASTSAPRFLTHLADGAIPKGHAVKMGTDKLHVAVGGAATDKLVGINQTDDVTTAEDHAEIAIPGGGGKAKLGGTVAAGDFLTSNATGKLIATTTPGDRYIAMAMEAGVLNDIIAVEVVAGLI